MDTFHAIKDSTTDAAVAKDYVDEILQIQRDKNAAKPRSIAQLPEDPEPDPDHVSAQEAANAALWATLEASLLPDTPAAPATSSNISSSALIKLLANSIKPSSGLSTALLTAAPHLASLSSPISVAIHVQKTWELRALIAEESNLEFLPSLLLILYPTLYSGSLSRIKKMEQIVEQYRKSEITVMDAFCAIKDSTTDAAVAKDYVDEILQIQRDKNAAKPRSIAQLPEDPETDPDHVSAQEAANAALWASLEASLLPDTPAAPATSSNISSSALIKLLANSIKPSSGLSTALLTAAPHLASLSSPISVAIHSFVDPLPHSLLRLIIKDQFVDFEKVHAAVTQPGLVHDDSKDFGSEYKLVRKESEIRHLPLTTEAQWFRVF
ncbi:hypothetical protein GYMLUDRAFT_253463 [Collybiopsis luxurians FD-317 M1]|uniref:Uncharacterized protein n=1 Tax=Collybiopsis luxurians FD-317 M1 TaxID=944289 RepID=A0A0D0C541_9AGAR|nr:hypothetical protein GYMLUDRAFT_253463 [Collybiopsis luxurians FD-317 M1]